MADQQETMTAEQYKLQVMKQRISEIVANYEDQIANQATRIAQLESELNRLTEQAEDDE